MYTFGKGIVMERGNVLSNIKGYVFVCVSVEGGGERVKIALYLLSGDCDT